MKKTIAKKSNEEKNLNRTPNNNSAGVLDELEKIGNSLTVIAGKAKKQFTNYDEKTKKTIIGAAAGVAVIAAGLIGLKKRNKKE